MKILLTLVLAGLFNESESSDLDLIRAVADASDENRAKFPLISAKFRLQDGDSATLDDARAGRFGTVYEARCSYAFHENHAIYEQKFAAADMAATSTWISPDEGNCRLLSFRAVTNGKLSLLEFINVTRKSRDYSYGYIIKPGSEHVFQNARFPLSLGFFENNRQDLGHLLRRSLLNDNTVKILSTNGDAVLGDKKVAYIKVADEFVTSEFWVDLERGAIPILGHILMRHGGTFDIVDSDIRFIPNHGWFPFEETSYLKQNRQSPGLTRRVIIDRAEFDRPPNPEVFKVESVVPVGMVNDAENISYTSLHKFWDLDNLPSSRGGNAVPTPKFERSGRPQMPGEISSSSRFPFGYGVLALVGIGIIVGLYRRWKR